MKDFYLTMQRKAKDFGCYILNGKYTPVKKGIIEEYSLFVVGDLFINKPAKTDNLNSLIKFAKENFQFSETNYKNGLSYSLVSFHNLVV